MRLFFLEIWYSVQITHVFEQIQPFIHICLQLITCLSKISDFQELKSKFIIE